MGCIRVSSAGPWRRDCFRLDAVNIRDFSTDKHKRVDDYIYGGGAGLLMQAEPVYQAYLSVREKIGRAPRVIYMTPQGQVFHQKLAEELATGGRPGVPLRPL